MLSDEFCNPEVAAAIAYEFTMFKYLCDAMELPSKESGAFIPGKIELAGTGCSSEEERNLSPLLESLLLHARVLRDFFYYRFRSNRDKRRPDDVIAQDYIPGWDGLRPPIGEYLSNHKERLDKALAHLTTTRVKYNAGDKRWDVAAIRRDLQPVVDHFKANLPPDRRPWFSEAG